MPEVVELESRRGFTLGGSEAAAACGVDKYRARVALWAEKTGRLERQGSEAAEWGKLLEPVIAAELERRGYELVPAPADGFARTDLPWLTGHPDAFTELAGEPGLVEIKTAGHYAGAEWSSEAGAPLAYLVQLHHYFALTGATRGLLACLVAGQRLELREVAVDEVALRRILELEEEFLGYLRRDEPPPPDGSSSAHETLLELYPTATRGEAVRLDEAGWRDYKRLRELREQADAIGRQTAELEQRLKARLGEAELLLSPYDDVVARWSSHERRAVDVKALRSALPHVAAEYTTATPVRRFTLE